MVVPRPLLFVRFGVRNDNIHMRKQLFLLLHISSTSLFLMVTVGHEVSSRENTLT